MTRTAHDALFKAAFAAPRHASGLLRAVLPLELHESIAWSTLRSVSPNAVDPRLRRQRNDLLFRARVRGARDSAQTYFLLEHQSHVDERMVLRVLAYLVRFWEQRTFPLPPVITAVVSHEPEGWQAPREFGEIVAPGSDLIPKLDTFLPNFSLNIADLSTLDHDDLLGWSLPPFPKLSLLFLRDARSKGELLEHSKLWLPLCDQLLSSPRSEHPFSQLLHYAFCVLEKDEFEQICALMYERLPQTRDTIMTKAEALLRQGRQEGRQEGLQQGLQQGRQTALRSALLDLIALKFGTVPPTHAARIESANIGELSTYITRILFAPTLDALFATTEHA